MFVFVKGLKESVAVLMRDQHFFVIDVAQAPWQQWQESQNQVTYLYNPVEQNQEKSEIKGRKWVETN